MYWRVRKVSPEQVLRTYGVHAVCIVSVLANLVMITKLQPSNALSKEQRTNFGEFAQGVTRHITDYCFMSYETSKMALRTELSGPVQKMLAQAEVIPKSAAEMKAMARQLDGTKTVSATVITEVNVSEPDANMNGWVPVEVSGKIVQHSAEGVNGPSPFRFRYWIGQVGTAPDLKPIVANMKEETPKAQP